VNGKLESVIVMAAGVRWSDVKVLSSRPWLPCNFADCF